MEIDLYKDSIGKDKMVINILKDIWPTNKEIEIL